MTAQSYGKGPAVFAVITVGLFVLASLFVITSSTLAARANTKHVSSQSSVAAMSTITPFRGAGIVKDACSDITTLHLSWYYTWAQETACGITTAEFVPMMWGDWCTAGVDCAVAPAEIVASGATTLLGFNEPNSSTQANMTVQRALDLWSYLSATPLRLGSPSVSFDRSGTGQKWLKAFMAGVRSRDLRVDFLTVHWYGDCKSPSSLVSFLRGLRSYGLPIWVTEFSCWYGTESTNRTFAGKILPTLLHLPYVERVAWFTNRPYDGGWQQSALVSNAGVLTSVGQTYSESPACRRANGSRVQSSPCPPR